MWPTTHGRRCLAGDEAQLIRRAVGMMVDYLVAEGREGDDHREYAVEWFDQWDWQQRLWLLERVTLGLLTDASPPEPAAMWEAAIDAIFAEIRQQVETEIANEDVIQDSTSWRQSVIDAFRSQNRREPDISLSHTGITAWHLIITQLADAILGVRIYRQAESFRDRDIEQTRKFLTQKGLPSDFLEQIPPLRTADQTQQSIDQIQLMAYE